jgi:protein-disulfide isomerase
MIRKSLFAATAVFLIGCAGKPDATPDSTTATTASSSAGTVATPPAANAPEDTSLVRADKARIMGSPTAKVWFVMSSDFQCPFCREFHDDLWKRIEKEYVQTGKIRVAFLNHPMYFHALAIPAAEAAMCAAKQDKFWPMHDSLFATQAQWTKNGNPQGTFEALAKSLGLRMNDWSQCMTSHATKAMVEADLARSMQGGVKGTPSFFIGNQLAIVGIAPWSAYKRAIDSTLAAAGGR